MEVSPLPATWSTRILPPQAYLTLVVVVSTALTFHVLSIFSFIIYVVAVLATCFLPNYGKFLNYFETWMEEDFVTAIPRSTVVTTMVLDGNISIEEFRALFQKNVLQAKYGTNRRKNRYPELKQYLTTFLGFRIWKDDPYFQIENHIVERTIPFDTSNNGSKLLDNIHQKLLNLPFHKQRSPWEIILIRNVPTECLDLQQDNNNEPSPPVHHVVACRMHHILADGKCTLKLLVECLGEKPLKTAVPQTVRKSLVDKLTFYLFFPFHYVSHLALLSWLLLKCHRHPWKVPNYWRDGNVKTLVAFSPKLPISEMKQVAKRNGVTSSAVLMSAVAGGMRSCDEVLGQGEVTIGYPVPKPNHPEYMTNHLYCAFIPLPTDKEEPLDRLQACNKSFLWEKTSQQGRYLDMITLTAGSQLFPVTRLAVNQFTPTGITNIAGDEEGFSVGNSECVDFRMSVGTLGGVAGVVFCAFSYKDGIRVAVIAKETKLGKEKAEKLVQDIFKEFKTLTNYCPLQV